MCLSVLEQVFVERNDIVQRILYECTDIDGFLVRLHSLNIFDADKYHALMTDIMEYHAIIGLSTMMERRVAGALYALEKELENAMRYALERQAANAEDIATADVEVWELILMVFDGPQETDEDALN